MSHWIDRTRGNCSLPVQFKYIVPRNVLLSVPLFLCRVALHSCSQTGQTEEHTMGCLGRETTWTIILYTEHSSVTRCHDNRMTQKYEGVLLNLPGSTYSLFQHCSWLTDCEKVLFTSCSFPIHFFDSGSYIQSAEKSFSMVKGGRVREAAALAWERQGPAPDRTSYKNWAKSVLENPAVVESQVKSNTNEMTSILKKIKKINQRYTFTKSWCIVCVGLGSLDHRSGSGNPMCCHKEETPEEGPAAVPGRVW